MLSKKDMHLYQDDAVHNVINTPKCGLLADMGLGKTIIMLTAIREIKKSLLKAGKKPLTQIVVAPPRVVENVWDNEALLWKHTKGLKFQTLVGSPAEREAQIWNNIGKVDVFIMSVGLWEWLCAVCIKYNKIPFDWLICDESHYYKNPKPNRTNYATQFANIVDRVTLLTGTPSSKGYHNLYTQMKMIIDQDAEAFESKSYDHFKQKYFFVNEKKHLILVRDELCMREIERMSKGKFFRYDKADYLEEIKSHEPVIWVDLPSDVRKHYDDMEKDMYFKVEESHILATSNAQRNNKLSQIANGRVLNEIGEVVHLHDNKTQAISEICQSTDKNILVAYNFIADKQHLLDNLKGSHHYKGSARDTQRWNDNPNTGLVYVCYPGSVGAGINLQHGGSTSIWYSLPIGRRDDFDQFMARTARQGQKDECTFYHIQARDTVDQNIYEKMIADGDQQKVYLDSLNEKKKWQKKKRHFKAKSLRFASKRRHKYLTT